MTEIKTEVIESDNCEDIMERAPCCLLRPIPGYDDFDIFGPFDSYEEAQEWAKDYPGCVIRVMVTKEFVIAHGREVAEAYGNGVRPGSNPGQAAEQRNARARFYASMIGSTAASAAPAFILPGTVA
jgi:hypothetical protein